MDALNKPKVDFTNVVLPHGAAVYYPQKSNEIHYVTQTLDDEEHSLLMLDTLDVAEGDFFSVKGINADGDKCLYLANKENYDLLKQAHPDLTPIVLSGSDLAVKRFSEDKRLAKSLLCYVSTVSEADALEQGKLAIITEYWANNRGREFLATDWNYYAYAVPLNRNLQLDYLVG